MKLINITGDDPWNNEENKYSFYYKGCLCLILRNHLGALCGYVGVNSTNVFYQTEPPMDLIVYGNITYAGYGDTEPIGSPWFQRPIADAEGKTLWWVGFTCSYSDDFCPALAENIKHRVAPDAPYLPASMGGVAGEYKDIFFVINELVNLVDQITEV